MYLAERIRLYPTSEQEELFRKFAGAARFAYNACLGYKISRYTNENLNTTVSDCRAYLRDLRDNKKEYAWLSEIPMSITYQAIEDLETAYKNFFKRGNKGFPRFKKKGRCRDSFYQRTDRFCMPDETHVKITGIKSYIRIKKHPIITKVSNSRVTFDGKYWYLSYGYEVEPKSKSTSNHVIGIDLGIKNLAVTSDNVTYANINKSKHVRQLNKRKKRLQRQLSKKFEMNKVGNTFVKTNNIIKLQDKLRQIDRTLREIRKTYNHTVTKELVKTTPKAIVIEDLNVKGLMKNRHLSKAIGEQGWYQIRQMLEYKCQLYGIQLIVADRFYASSKLCSHCGAKKVDLQLSDRLYVCDKCMTSIDRDYNAALNLQMYGKNILKIA